jgi:hypothetical protein
MKWGHDYVGQIIGFFLKILLLPVRFVIRLMAGILSRIFRPLGVRVDASASLSNFINQISSSMATQRGLLLMIGTGLLVLSLVGHALALIIMVSTSGYSSSLYLLCIPFALLHVGLLVGFTGMMLATPLGQGYKDNK